MHKNTRIGGDKYAGRWGKYMQAGGDNFAISVVGVNLISVVGSNFWVKFAGRGIGKNAINIGTHLRNGHVNTFIGQCTCTCTNKHTYT